MGEKEVTLGCRRQSAQNGCGCVRTTSDIERSGGSARDPLENLGDSGTPWRDTGNQNR